MCNNFLLYNFPLLITKTQTHYTNLQIAVIYRDKKKFDKYLSDDICKHDLTGSSALMLACQNGFSYRFDELSKFEAGKQNIHGYTALMYAAEYGNVEFIPSLMKKEGGLKNTRKQTAYQLAKNSEIAQLIEQISYQINQKLDVNLESGGTILHYLATNSDLTEELIQQHKQYLKRQDLNGQTALMRAVIYKNVHNIFLLLKYEAGIRDFNNLTAYDYQYDIDTNIAYQMEYQVATDLFKSLLNKTYLIDNLNLHINQKFEYNIESSRTALMLAAEQGNLEACKLLIDEAGMQSQRGFTALMYAAAENHIEIVQLLLEKEQGRIDNEGQCALHYLLKYQTISSILEQLAKCEVGILNNKGEGAFYILINRGTVKELLPKQQYFWNLMLQKEIHQTGIQVLIKYLDKNNVPLSLEQNEYDIHSLMRQITHIMIKLNQIFTQQQINDLAKIQTSINTRKEYLGFFIALFILSKNPYKNTNIVFLLIKYLKFKVQNQNEKIGQPFLHNSIITNQNQLNISNIQQQLKQLNNVHNILVDNCYRKDSQNISAIIKNDTLQHIFERKQSSIRKIQDLLQTEWLYQSDIQHI